MEVSKIEVKESSDGELYFNLPDDLLSRLGECDEIKFVERDGGFVIKKAKYESIQLDIDDEELFKYMKHAHENLLSLNEWVEKCLTKFMEVEDTN
tara:strand:+ start:289 stop:573 length:285 start_codon:yes stop_codon:yes gene_type:complete